MKKADQNEFNSYKDNSDYSEFKHFKAEQYYVKENAHITKENFYVKEFSDGTKSKIKNHENSLDLNDLESQVNSPNVAESISTPSSTITSSTTTTAQVAAQTSGVASTATVGASVAGAVVGLGVITTAITAVIVNIGVKEKEHQIGTDYIALNLDLDSFKEADESLGEEDRSYKLIVYNDEENKVCERDAFEGEHTYLFPNLKRNQRYTAEVVAYSKSNSEKTSYWNYDFSTPEESEPAAVYDEFETKFAFDSVFKTTSFTTGIYISDEFNKLSYVDLCLKDNKGYTTYYGEMSEDGYLRNTFSNISGDSFDLSVFATVNGEYSEIFKKHFNIDFPSGWDDIVAKPTLSIEGLTHEETVRSVKISGNCKENRIIDGDYSGTIYFLDSDGNVHYEECVPLEMNDDHDEFSVETMVPYNLSSYYLVISSFENGFENNFYTSPTYSYNFNHDEFGASMVTPDLDNENVDIIFYGEDSIYIEVDTEFELANNDNDFYFYNAYLIDSDTGDVLKSIKNSQDRYCVFGEVESNHNFDIKYELMATFADGNHLFDDIVCGNPHYYETPELDISDNLGIKNGHYTVDYDAAIPPYVYYMELQLSVYVDDNMDQVYHEDITNSPSGTIELTTLSATSGTIRIEYDLVFNVKNGTSSSVLNFGEKYYNASEKLVIDNLTIGEFSSNSPSSFTGRVQFDGIFDNNRKLKIEDDNGNVLYNDGFENDITFESDDVEIEKLSFVLLDSNGIEITKISKDIEFIDYSSLSYSIQCPNPGDSTVTYNDDGTINLYRNVNFVDNTGGHVSYSASLYSDMNYDSNTGKYSYVYSYQNFTQDKVSAIEDIDIDSTNGYVCFIYEVRYQPNLDDNVYYTFFTETPSGSISKEKEGYYYGQNDDGPGYRLTIYNTGIIDNKLLIDGVEHQFKDYDSDTNYMQIYDTTVDITNSEIIIYANCYYNSSCVYALEETGKQLKGNIYFEMKYTV